MAVERVVINEAELRKLASSEPVRRELAQLAAEVARRAEAKAPISANGSHGRPAGYLRSQIKVTLGQDSEGAYADVISAARTPEGFQYGSFWDHRIHFLREAINEGTIT